MRIAAKADKNQVEIVNALRAAGATVQHLHTVGRGCPDLLVGFRGVNYLMEVKMPGKKLTLDERKWMIGWKGDIHVVSSIEYALAVIGAVNA